jgi:Flp pilus assembly protein TadG
MMRAIARLVARSAADRGGGAAVEFGMTLPFLIALIYAIIELSRMLWGMAVLNFSVEQAARYAVINCASTCSPDAAHYAANWAALAIGLAPAASAFTVNSGGNCGTGISGTVVSVSVNFTTPVLLLLPRGNSFSATLRAQSCYPN